MINEKFNAVNAPEAVGAYPHARKLGMTVQLFTKLKLA